MRSLSALLLSLVLALASVSMAVARGQMPMGTTMTLCSRGQAVTVTLDANGSPVTAPPHLCPDCLSAVTALDLATAPDLIAPDHALALPASFGPPAPRREAPQIAFQARGPPAFSV